MTDQDTISKLTGVFAPITTPFAADEEVDYPALVENVRRYAATGLRGFLALGSNGENRSLSEEERLSVLGEVVGHKAPGQVVMAGASYAAQLGTERFLAAAAELGADFGLVLPPDYFKKQMTDEVLYRYFSSLADGSEIPVVLYHAPQFCSVSISLDLARRLSDHPNIVGVKYSASTGIEEFLALEQPGFHVLAGSADFLFPAMLAGSLGGTVSLADYLPDLAVEIHRWGTIGDRDRGAALQSKINRINKAVSGTHGVSGVKAAMDMTGYRGGYPRRPLLPITAEAATRVHGLLVDEQVL